MNSSVLEKMITLERASQTWRLLNGVFCIYKPNEMNFNAIWHIIADNLQRDLNAMERNDPPPLLQINPPDPEAKLNDYHVTLVPDLRKHYLVAGPGYKKEDFYVRVGGGRSSMPEMAGVTIAGIGSGMPVFDRLMRRNPICAYHVQGKFGLRTDNYLETGRVIEKTTFKHVTSGAVERFLTMYQGHFQKQITSASNMDPQSQAAYELHSGGLVRPADASTQLIYRIKCIDFKLPYFTLEIHCINETDKFLLKVLNDIGEDLKTSAVCTKIRRVRWGNFTLEHALLRKHWSAEGIITSISECGPAVQRELEILTEPYLMKVPPDGRPMITGPEEPLALRQ